MHNKRTACLWGGLLVLLVMEVFGAAAPPIQPAGNQVGVDKQGHPIYQVKANGIEIGYKLIGSGEPLVMIMGLGWTMENWAGGVVEALSKQYQLILPDNRGVGYSTTNEAMFSCQLFAADVIGLLDALKVKKTNMLGYSMGSMIALELLLEYPQRFEKAVIYATANDGAKVDIPAKAKTSDNPTVRRQIEAIIQWKAPMEKVPFITNQVLLVIGTADTVVDLESSKALAAAIPGAWLIQFKNASHRLMLEAPGEFAKAVLAFLETNGTLEVK